MKEEPESEDEQSLMSSALKESVLDDYDVHLHYTLKIKKSQNSRNQGFSSFIRLSMEGYEPGARSGSIQINYGSGSGSRRPKMVTYPTDPDPKNCWTFFEGSSSKHALLDCTAHM
jgi:hypothetical protein